MELNDFIIKFAEQFDSMDVSDFSAETKFKELDDWSSITSLYTIAMIDENYGIQITGSDIKGSETLSDLFEKIKAKK
ncbi:MAG: acyl carrier protein [Treponema sp.]|nr:acyl carrier protein [Treponema sp.]